MVGNQGNIRVEQPVLKSFGHYDASSISLACVAKRRHWQAAFIAEMMLTFVRQLTSNPNDVTAGKSQLV